MCACLKHEHHERFFHAEFVTQAVPAGAFETETTVISEITEHDDHAGIPRVALGESVLDQPPSHSVLLVAGHYCHRAEPVSDDVERRVEHHPAEGDMPDDKVFRLGDQRHLDLAAYTQPFHQVRFSDGGKGGDVYLPHCGRVLRVLGTDADHGEIISVGRRWRNQMARQQRGAVHQ